MDDLCDIAWVPRGLRVRRLWRVRAVVRRWFARYHR